LPYNDGFTKKSITVKIPEEYSVLTQLLTEDEITIYEICENYPQIYETYYKVLERITLERDSHKEREIPEVNWIYGPPGSGKTEFA
jgi:Holliday junction resolvasome RuvABC ATP-dependent DNA helicase subunit